MIGVVSNNHRNKKKNDAKDEYEKVLTESECFTKVVKEFVNHKKIGERLSAESEAGHSVQLG